MGKIHKIINIVLISILLGVFLLGGKPVFGISRADSALRPPMRFGTQGGSLEVKNTIKTLSDKELVTLHQEDLLPKLTKRQQEVLTLLYLKNLPPKEVAKKLKIGKMTVSHHKTIGIEKLREYLDSDSDYQLVMRYKESLPELVRQRQLTKEEGQVLILFHIENRTPREISEELGISESIVSRHKTSGIKKLREPLDPNSDSQLFMSYKDSLPGLVAQKQLSEEQREVLTLAYIEFKSLRDMAQELKVSESTASRRKTSGIAILRKLNRGLHRKQQALREAI